MGPEHNGHDECQGKRLRARIHSNVRFMFHFIPRYSVSLPFIVPCAAMPDVAKLLVKRLDWRRLTL